MCRFFFFTLSVARVAFGCCGRIDERHLSSACERTALPPLIKRVAAVHRICPSLLPTNWTASSWKKTESRHLRTDRIRIEFGAADATAPKRQNGWRTAARLVRPSSSRGFCAPLLFFNRRRANCHLLWSGRSIRACFMSLFSKSETEGEHRRHLWRIFLFCSVRRNKGGWKKKREKMANRASFIGVSAEHLRHHRNPFVFPAQRNRRWQRNKTGAGRKKAETTAKFRIIFFFFYGDGLGRSDRLNLTHLRPSATVPAEKQISKNYYLDSQNCNDFFLNFKASWGILKRISLLR